ncbi:MAG: ABC transporter substrate-binding protein [Chitinispirillia bacterium]|nr:ABC transporter substrate-binding protein [Chitinispirillia bacterium]MCL2269234.1 ABC transporter substrate-binding protein [Chitinispirillia bacterium]
MGWAKFIRTLCLLLLLLLASCSNFSKPPDAAQEYITVGALFPLSGEYCHEGMWALNGLQLARQEINDSAGGVLGKKIDIIALDDRGDPEYAAEQYAILRERGVVAIIGSSFSDVTLAIARAAEKDGIPVISPTASNPAVTEGRRNVFRMIFLDDYQSRALASFALNSLGAKTALVLKGDPRYLPVASAFEEEFKAGGGVSVVRERYSSPNDFDNILAGYKSNQPDIIFCPADYIVAARLAEAVYRVGLDKPKLIGTDAWDGILVFLREQKIMDRIFYATPFVFDDDDPAIARFSRAFFDQFSHMPLAPSALAYSSVQMLVAAMEASGGTEAEGIINAMKAHGADVLTGYTRFDAGNNPYSDKTGVYIMGIKNRHYTSVEKIRLPEPEAVR